MKNKNDRSSSRPSISRDADTAAGDEGLEERHSASPTDPYNNERMESSPRQKRSNVRTDDVRDLNSIDRTTTRRRGSESSSESEQQSGQKSSGRVFQMGPAHSSEKSEDDSLSRKDLDRKNLDRKNLGSSRQDQSSSDKSSSSGDSTRSDRLNEDQDRNSRDLDRSKM